MNAENVGAHCCFRQIDKEDLVESTFADQFRRQCGNVIRRRDDEYAAFLLRKPGQKSTQHAPRGAAVAFAGGDSLLDFVDPEHAGGHDVGRRERLAQVAFGFAHVLVVDRGEVQAQQRHAEDSGSRARGNAFAAALNAQQQHAFRRIQMRRRSVEGDTALSQPVLESGHAAKVGELRRVVLEAQHTAAIEQCVFRLHQSRQVVRLQCAIIEDRLARQPLGVAGRQSAQILDQQLEGLAIRLDSRAGVHLSPFARDLLDDGVALGAIGKGELEMRGKVLELARQRELVTDQHQRARHLREALADVLQQPDVHRVGEEWVEVEEHIKARLVGGANALEHLRRVCVVLLRAAEIHIDSPQSVGHRPLKNGRVTRAGTLQRQAFQQRERSRFIARFDQDQWNPAAQQRRKFRARIGRYRRIHYANLTNAIGAKGELAHIAFCLVRPRARSSLWSCPAIAALAHERRWRICDAVLASQSIFDTLRAPV